jgi:hypothetical protein
MKKWFRPKSIFIKFLIIGWSSILLIVLPSFLIMSYFLNKAERADRIHTMTDSIIIQMLGYEEGELIGKPVDVIFDGAKTDHRFLDEIIRKNCDFQLVTGIPQ